MFSWGERSVSLHRKKYECMPCVTFQVGPVDNKPFVCKYQSRCDKTITTDDVINEINHILENAS